MPIVVEVLAAKSQNTSMEKKIKICNLFDWKAHMSKFEKN